MKNSKNNGHIKNLGIWSKKHPIFVSITVFVILMFCFLSLGGVENKQHREVRSTSTTRVAYQPKEVGYKIIEEEDFSYLNCKRMGIRIIVPDNSDKRDINFTLEKIGSTYLNEWQDVTVWAWGYSEEEKVGFTGATKGIYEKSNCN